MDASSSTTCGRGQVFPDDLVFSILARLPVKSLLRFKSVCKTWRDIITSPSFISLHLANSRTGKRIRSDTCGGVSVSIQHYMGNEDRKPEFVYDFLDIHIAGSNGITCRHTSGYLFNAIPYEAPYGAAANTVEYIPFSIVGYYDGIFCLSWRHLYRDMPPFTDIDFSGHTVIALCNPAIRELRVLPMSHSDFPPYRTRGFVETDYAPGFVDIGFGYDPKTNDYKVVKIVTFLDSWGLDILEVYSMKTNTWQNVDIRGNDHYAAVQGIRVFPGNSSIYTTDNDGGGVLHWIMARPGESLIVSFLMDDYSFRVTRLPSKYAWSMQPLTALLHNKLALILSAPSDDRFEVLVMNNYERDDDSWSHVATIKIKDLVAPAVPLGFWKDNVLLMCGVGDPTTYLFDIAQTQSMPLEQFTREMDFFYTETLVSVKPQH